MLFQTPEFLVLFAVVALAIVFVKDLRWQHGVLLVASLIFYGWWDVRFLVLLIASTALDYIAARGVAGHAFSWRSHWNAALWLAVSGIVLMWPNWPLMQLQQQWDAWPQLLTSHWTGMHAAVVACLTGAIIWPLLARWFYTLSEVNRRRGFLIASMATNLGMLAFFKYYGFFVDNMRGIGTWLGYSWNPPLLNVALPVGISFYTFQTMSYTIDVYRGHEPAEKSLGRVALFVAYFPQLVAGPILRPGQFMPKLDQPWTLESGRYLSGFHLALVGLVKKVLIADSMARLVDILLGSPDGRPSLMIMLGALLFAVQIYCDFSGYTDIARGVSRILGVEIPLNFAHPYFSTSVVEFWRRWHISLSTWLRDYLYIPLGGNRGSTLRTYFNLMVTMVLGGLWHGAAWNFVIWGAYQGALLCANRLLREWIAPTSRLALLCEHPLGCLVRWSATLYLTLLGWLIFRVNSAENLWYAVKKFIVFDGRWELFGLGAGVGAPFTALLALLVFVVLHAYGHFFRRWPEQLDVLPRPLLFGLYALLGALLFYGWPTHQEPFIYFQF